MNEMGLNQESENECGHNSPPLRQPVFTGFLHSASLIIRKGCHLPPWGRLFSPLFSRKN